MSLCASHARIASAAENHLQAPAVTPQQQQQPQRMFVTGSFLPACEMLQITRMRISRGKITLTAARLERGGLQTLTRCVITT